LATWVSSRPSLPLCQQQRAGDLGHASVEEREDEQLVPEDVTLVGLAGPATRGHADVEPDRVGRHRLQQVKHVQAQQHLDVQLEAGVRQPDLHLEAAPQVFPCARMGGQQVVEAAGARDCRACHQPALGDGRVARGVERNRLFQHQCCTLREINVEFLPDVTRFLDQPARNLERLSVADHPRARRLRDVDVRLAGAHPQQHAVLADRFAGQWLEVPVVEFPVEPGAGVDDAPVDRATHGDAARPVLGSQRQLQHAEVHVAHGDQAPLLQQAAPALLVLEAQRAQQQAAVQIQFLVVGQNRHGARVKPRLIGHAKAKREPVGEVDQILVLDRAAGDVGAQPVVAAGEVSPRIVNLVRHRPRRRRARCEIAIAEGAQRLAGALGHRIEALEAERPRRRGLDCHADLREARDHDVGAGRTQRLRLAVAIDADHAAETAGAPGRDAGDRVLDHDRARRRDPEAPGRLQERIRRRLAREREAGNVHAVDARIEQRRDTGRLQHRRAVVAGRHDRGLDRLRPQHLHQRDRWRVGLDAVLL